MNVKKEIAKIFATYGKKGGKAKSKAKVKAAKSNGKKGGRPKKTFLFIDEGNGDLLPSRKTPRHKLRIKKVLSKYGKRVTQYVQSNGGPQWQPEGKKEK